MFDHPLTEQQVDRVKKIWRRELDEDVFIVSDNGMALYEIGEHWHQLWPPPAPTQRRLVNGPFIMALIGLLLSIAAIVMVFAL